MEFCFILCVLVFYLSISATEGWKWRIDNDKEDDSKVITASNYHIWRAVTNLSVILSPLTILLSDISIIRFLFISLLTNIIGWVIYERLMSYIIHDDFLAIKDKFRLFGDFYIDRINPPTQVVIGGVSITLLIIL